MHPPPLGDGLSSSPRPYLAPVLLRDGSEIVPVVGARRLFVCRDEVLSDVGKVECDLLENADEPGCFHGTDGEAKGKIEIE